MFIFLFRPSELVIGYPYLFPIGCPGVENDRFLGIGSSFSRLENCDWEWLKYGGA
jgi:hypothetical protein